MDRRLRLQLCVLLLVLALLPVLSLAALETGRLDDRNPEDEYVFSAEVGQRITIKTEATSGDLDTVVQLFSPEGDLVGENDDANDTTLNAYLNYVAQTSGDYTVIISSFGNTSGEYVISITVSGEGSGTTQSSQTQTVRGYMSDTTPDETISIRLEPNQAVIASARGFGDLDTYLLLTDADDVIVGENDDRSYTSLDSELIYVSSDGGDYTIVISNFPGTAGDYEATYTIVPGDRIPIVLRVDFSGTPQYIETENFRIHYTLEGVDATTEEYVQDVAAVMEEVWQIQIGQFNWREPIRDGVIGGDDRFDVYIINLVNNEDGGDYGVTVVEPPIFDDLNTSDAEENLSASYLLLDNDYDVFDQVPADIMRATAAHEFGHAVQFGYDASEPFSWYLEATSTWLETQTYPEQQDATGYVVDLFTYPEICLGASGEPDPSGGLLQYGYWLFLQSIVDAHDVEFVRDLWEAIRVEDGWAPLEATLGYFEEDVPLAVARYHLQNLVRDYDLTPEFSEDVVWLENTIDGQGRWTYRGSGVQELGANYYRLDLPAGVYELSLDETSSDLEIWFIGMAGAQASAIPLAQRGLVDLAAYEDAYVMVFNSAYDDDLESCEYASYLIQVENATGTPAKSVFVFDTRHFIAPD